MGIPKPIKTETNEKGCHIVTSHALDKYGYVKVGRNKKNWHLHRWVYVQIHGEIPDGLVIMHSCDEPSCINLDHLSLGTYKDNSHDRDSKGRHRNKYKKIKELTEKEGM